MKRRNFVSQVLLTAPLLLSHRNATAAADDQEPSVVINAGVGGNNSADIIERLEKDCLSQQPDLTVLMVGTNDMNSRKHVPAEIYEKNMRKIVASIMKVGSKIVLMNILPVHEPYLLTRHDPQFYKPEGHQERLKRVNNLIRKISTEYDLSFLDIHHIFKTIGEVGTSAASLIQNETNSHKTDGVHPTPDGYRVIGLAVYQHIVNHALSHSRVICLGDSITQGDGSIDGQNYPAYLKKLFS
jgi:lysophospholipase L1-like esterase